MDSTKPPSYWLKLLQERAGIISSFKQGLTDEEFDLLCQKEARFKKDLSLELRDLNTIINFFTQGLKKSEIVK